MLILSANTDIIISQFFNENYDYLYECAKNILKRVRCSKKDMINDLISETFIYIDNNKTKLDNQIQSGNIEAIAINYMNKQLAWSQTSFKKNFLYPTLDNQNNHLTTNVEYFYSVKEDSDSEIRRNLPQELQSVDRDEEQHLYDEMKDIDKYNLFIMAFEDLPVHKRALFNLIYREGHNTTGKLYKYFKSQNIKESSSSCYYMLKGMRDYFKQKLTEYNNKHNN